MCCFLRFSALLSLFFVKLPTQKTKNGRRSKNWISADHFPSPEALNEYVERENANDVCRIYARIRGLRFNLQFVPSFALNRLGNGNGIASSYAPEKRKRPGEDENQSSRDDSAETLPMALRKKEEQNSGIKEEASSLYTAVPAQPAVTNAVEENTHSTENRKGAIGAQISPDIEIFLACPRPKVADKLIETLAGFGVWRIWIFNADKVEKTYLEAKKFDPKNSPCDIEDCYPLRFIFYI
jgi:hypothetical protein